MPALLPSIAELLREQLLTPVNFDRPSAVSTQPRSRHRPHVDDGIVSDHQIDASCPPWGVFHGPSHSGRPHHAAPELMRHTAALTAWQ